MRTAVRTAVLALGFALLTGACSDPSPSGRDGSEARLLAGAARKLRAQLDTTAATAFPDVAAQPQNPGDERAGCQVGTDDYEESYSIFVTLPAEELASGVERVRRHWESQGHTVRASGTEVPTLQVDDAGDIEFGLTANRRDRRIYLFGTTSCFRVPD